MVASQFYLNSLCFDQLKFVREQGCTFCFSSFVVQLEEKHAKSANTLSQPLNMQLMETSFIAQKPLRYIGNQFHL